MTPSRSILFSHTILNFYLPCRKYYSLTIQCLINGSLIKPSENCAIDVYKGDPSVTTALFEHFLLSVSILFHIDFSKFNTLFDEVTLRLQAGWSPISHIKDDLLFLIRLGALFALLL